jgi:hypothetical protein
LTIWNSLIRKLSSIFCIGCSLLTLQNSASRPGRFFPGERGPGIHWRGAWVGPRAGLDAVEKRKISCPCRGSNPGSPARSPSTYQARYPGSCVHFSKKYCFAENVKGTVLCVSTEYVPLVTQESGKGRIVSDQSRAPVNRSQTITLWASPVNQLRAADKK